MPRQYVAMRDKFAGQGMDYDDAQTKAAKIYNARHPGAPVTSASHDEDEAEAKVPSKKKRRMPVPYKK